MTAGVPLTAFTILLSSLAAGCGGSSLEPGHGPDGGGGAAGSGGSGGTGACPTLDPSPCDPTYAQQSSRAHAATCSGGGVTYDGDCGAYRVWVSDSDAGKQTTCLFDDQGTLVGQRVCGAGGGACGDGPSCVTTGVAPTPYPSDSLSSCAAIGAVCGCAAPEVVRPGTCEPTLAQLKQRVSCSAIGTCAGYQVWTQSPTWIMDLPVGDEIICVYDSGGALVGERVCSLNINAGPACDTYMLFLHCATSGVVPFNPSSGTCNGTVNAPAPGCTGSDGGAPDAG